jgi:hypothetical protein
MNDIGGMFRYGQITGGYDEGQAEYVRVLFIVYYYYLIIPICLVGNWF